MKQIYNQHSHFNESAYKGDVRVYKEVQIIIDYQQVTNLCKQKVCAK